MIKETLMAESDTTTNYDAQQIVEEIASGEEKAPSVNVEADYERSKEYNVSEIDKTSEGAKAAEAATSTKAKSSKFSEVKPDVIEEGGNPDSYRSLAKDTNPNL
jgi:hypothetical protein